MVKHTFDTAIEKFKGKTYVECYKLVFMWVKQEKVNPEMMEKLMVFIYKKFHY